MAGGAAKVLDQDARVDLLLDVDRRRVGDEVVVAVVDRVGVRVLAAPDQLGVEALVAGVADLADLLDLRVDEVLGVGGRDVGPLVLCVMASTGVGPLGSAYAPRALLWSSKSSRSGSPMIGAIAVQALDRLGQPALNCLGSVISM